MPERPLGVHGTTVTFRLSTRDNFLTIKTLSLPGTNTNTFGMPCCCSHVQATTSSPSPLAASLFSPPSPTPNTPLSCFIAFCLTVCPYVHAGPSELLSFWEDMTVMALSCTWLSPRAWGTWVLSWWWRALQYLVHGTDSINKVSQVPPTQRCILLHCWLQGLHCVSALSFPLNHTCRGTLAPPLGRGNRLQKRECGCWWLDCSCLGAGVC